MEPIVIARLAIFRMARALILSTAGLTALSWYFLTNDFGNNEVRRWIVLAGVAVALVTFAAISWQLYFGRGRAVWIADGKLVSKLGWGSTVALGDITDAQIEDVYIGTPMLKPYYEKHIVVKLRDGGQMAIDIRYLSEPAPVVLARLRDALGLPKTA